MAQAARRGGCLSATAQEAVLQTALLQLLKRRKRKRVVRRKKRDVGDRVDLERARGGRARRGRREGQRLRLARSLFVVVLPFPLPPVQRPHELPGGRLCRPSRVHPPFAQRDRFARPPPPRHPPSAPTRPPARPPSPRSIRAPRPRGPSAPSQPPSPPTRAPTRRRRPAHPPTVARSRAATALGQPRSTCASSSAHRRSLSLRPHPALDDAALVQVPSVARIARPHGPLLRPSTSSCRRALGLTVTPLAPRHRLVRTPSSVAERRAVPRQIYDGRQLAPRRRRSVRRPRRAQSRAPLDPVVRAQQVALEDLGVLRVGVLVGLASARLARAPFVAASSVRHDALALARRRLADRPGLRLGAVVVLLPGAAGHLRRAPRAAGPAATTARPRHDARLASPGPLAALPRHQPGRDVALALAVARPRPAPPPLAPPHDAPPARQPAPGPRPARQLCRAARRASSRQPAVELVVALARVRHVGVVGARRVHGAAPGARRPRRARSAAAAAAALLAARAGTQRVVDGLGDGRGREVLQRRRRRRLRRAVPRHVVRRARAAPRGRLAEPVHARRREDRRRARPAAAAQGLGRDDGDGDAGLGARGRAGAARRQPQAVVGAARRRRDRRRGRCRRRRRQEGRERRARRERLARARFGLLPLLLLALSLLRLSFRRLLLFLPAHHHPPERHLGRLERRRRRRRRRNLLDDVRLRAVRPLDRRPAHLHDPDLVRDARRRPVPVHAAGRPPRPRHVRRRARRVVHERPAVPRRADRRCERRGRRRDDRAQERRGARREREEVGPPGAGPAREGDPLSGSERGGASRARRDRHLKGSTRRSLMTLALCCE